jgi:hypothetical protein
MRSRKYSRNAAIIGNNSRFAQGETNLLEDRYLKIE